MLELCKLDSKMLSKSEFVFVVVTCLGFVSGQTCPEDDGKEKPLSADCPVNSEPKHEYSSICDPFSEMAGPWYIYYWAAPKSMQLYPDDVTCARIFGTPLDNNTNHYQHYMYYSNGTMVQGELTSRSDIIGENCCYYSIQQGNFSHEVRVVEYDKFKYVFAIVTFDDKRYLLVYVRDLRVMSDCSTNCLFKKWLNRTEKKSAQGFKSASKNCRCLSNISG